MDFSGIHWFIRTININFIFLLKSRPLKWLVSKHWKKRGRKGCSAKSSPLTIVLLVPKLKEKIQESEYVGLWRICIARWDVHAINCTLNKKAVSVLHGFLRAEGYSQLTPSRYLKEYYRYWEYKALIPIAGSASQGNPKYLDYGF